MSAGALTGLDHVAEDRAQRNRIERKARCRPIGLKLSQDERTTGAVAQSRAGGGVSFTLPDLAAQALDRAKDQAGYSTDRLNRTIAPGQAHEASGHRESGRGSVR
jgi:hypothetical protein